MTTLSLVPRELVDIHGTQARHIHDVRHHFLVGKVDTEEQLEEVLKNFKDLGLVTYEGHQYYASIYTPLAIPDDE